jgi:hypothetical protein
MKVTFVLNILMLLQLLAPLCCSRIVVVAGTNIAHPRTALKKKSKHSVGTRPMA